MLSPKSSTQILLLYRCTSQLYFSVNFRVTFKFSLVPRVLCQAYTPYNNSFPISSNTFYVLFLATNSSCCFKHQTFPATGGKAFNTRQQPESCRMRLASYTATCCHLSSATQSHATCCLLLKWLKHTCVCDNVACHVLPKCCLGGIVNLDSQRHEAEKVKFC